MAKFSKKTIDLMYPEQLEMMARQGVDIGGIYRHYRKIAQDRLRKMEYAGYSRSYIVSQYKNRFPALSEMGGDLTTLSDALSLLTHFLNLKTSTVGGMRTKEKKAAATFARHYGKELSGLPQGVFGEMMKAIKSEGDAKARYGNWQKTYREIQGAIADSGKTPREVEKALNEGLMKIKIDIETGKGGLYDAETGFSIANQWQGMGR